MQLIFMDIGSVGSIVGWLALVERWYYLTNPLTTYQRTHTQTKERKREIVHLSDARAISAAHVRNREFEFGIGLS